VSLIAIVSPLKAVVVFNQVFTVFLTIVQVVVFTVTQVFTHDIVIIFVFATVLGYLDVIEKSNANGVVSDNTHVFQLTKYQLLQACNTGGAF
jgi:hypothetical protein